MAFTLFEPLFREFDSATATYVNDISTKMIATITPVLSVGLTVGFLFYSLAVIRGTVQMPVSDLLWRCFRIGVIVSIATAGGLYQSSIADVIVSTPDALAQALVGSDAVNTSSAGGVLDTTAGKAFDVAAKQWEKASVFSKQGIMYVAYSCMIIISTAVLVSIGGAFLIMAKVAIAILVGIGPLFIFMLLWQPTQRFFEVWVAQLLNYALLTVLTSVLFLFLMGIYGNYMGDIKPDSNTMNAIYALAGALVITGISALILLQLPSIAGGLSGGLGLGYMREASAARRMTGSTGQTNAKTGQREGRSGVMGAAHATGAGVGRAVAGAGTAVRAVAAFARGRMR